MNETYYNYTRNGRKIILYKNNVCSGSKENTSINTNNEITVCSIKSVAVQTRDKNAGVNALPLQSSILPFLAGHRLTLFTEVGKKNTITHSPPLINSSINIMHTVSDLPNMGNSQVHVVLLFSMFNSVQFHWCEALFRSGSKIFHRACGYIVMLHHNRRTVNYVSAIGDLQLTWFRRHKHRCWLEYC